MEDEKESGDRTIDEIIEKIKKRDISLEVDKIRGRFIGPLIRMENDLDKFLKRYFSTLEKEDEFQKEILEAGFFNLRKKIEIFNRIVNKLVKESDGKKKLEEKKPNFELEKIKDYRNKFAHDEIVKKNSDTFEIKSDDGTEIIDEEYEKEFDEKVKKARTGIDFFYQHMLDDMGKLSVMFEGEHKEMFKAFEEIKESTSETEKEE